MYQENTASCLHRMHIKIEFTFMLLKFNIHYYYYF